MHCFKELLAAFVVVWQNVIFFYIYLKKAIFFIIHFLSLLVMCTGKCKGKWKDSSFNCVALGHSDSDSDSCNISESSDSSDCGDSSGSIESINSSDSSERKNSNCDQTQKLKC